MARDRTEWQRPWTSDVPVGGAAVDTAEPVDGVAAPAPIDGSVDAPTSSSPSTSSSPFAAPAPADARSPFGTSAPASSPFDSPSSVDAPAPAGAPPASTVPTSVDLSSPRPDRRPRGGLAMVLVASLLGGVVGSVATLALSGDDEPTVAVADPRPTDGPDVQAPTIDIGDLELNNVVPAVAQAVTPSVVRVDILGDAGAGVEDELGLGSGVIYRSDGYVITNNHVVEGSDRLEVTLADGSVYDAEVIGTDPLNDLAVLKIEATGLPAINLRDGDDPIVGETAIAIGSPFGLDASVTAGVVSAVGRDITVPDGIDSALLIPAVVQTDAAINPGNSGGALVDAQGRLLGINTAILSGSGGSQGVGFAIPVAQAVDSANQLIETGEVRHAFLGVRGEDVDRQIAERFDLEEPRGALLTEITPDTGAEAAGLQPDDVVVEMGGEPVDTMADLAAAVRRFRPGDTVEVVFIRDGERQTTELTLTERPERLG